MTEKDLRWNKFIEEICSCDLDTLSEIQRKAVLCFWYDAEMNSGGYCGYMDCYPETNPKELYNAILTIGNKKIADNYRKALTKKAEKDEWLKTDDEYYGFNPSLCNYLEEYVEKNKDAIFGGKSDNIKKTIIIYNSATGFTKCYAEWIAEETGGEAVELSAAKKKDLSAYDNIVFGGWAMAGTVTKLKWFTDNMDKWAGKKLAVYCVGASPVENPDLDEFFKVTTPKIGKAKLFYFQGGLSYENMSGGYKMMMKMFVKTLKLKKDKTEDDELQIKMLSSSYDISDKKYIQPLLEYLNA